MRYYLDIVTVRALSKELHKLQSNSFTSALVVMDLISGIGEREFNIRKHVIKNLIDSRFPVVWKLPEKIKAEAFTIIEIKESRVIGLQKLCNELYRSENLETFITNTEKEIYNIDFFKKLDKSYSDIFIEATLKGNQELKNIYTEQRVNNGKEFEDYAKQIVKSLASEVDANNAITIKVIAGHLAAQASKDDDLLTEGEVYNSYNHSIDIFMTAFSLFSAKKSGELGTPAKNDYTDLNHLLYLGSNPNLSIVTNDNMILKITAQSKTLLEYKQINGI